MRVQEAKHKAEFPRSSVLLRAHEQASAEAYIRVADAINAVYRSPLAMVTYEDTGRK